MVGRRTSNGALVVAQRIPFLGCLRLLVYCRHAQMEPAWSAHLPLQTASRRRGTVPRTHASAALAVSPE